MRNTILLVALCFVIVSNVFAGGPWPQPKGKGYFKLSEYWIVFDQTYSDAGVIQPGVKSGIFNTSVYAEYGITDRLTAIVNAPLFSRSQVDDLISTTTQEILVPGDAFNSIGDIDLGFKYGITQPGSKIPVSVSLFLGIPSGNDSGGQLKNLKTGDGEFNQLIRVDSGTGFNIGSLSAYLSGHAGFNNRSNNFSDEVRFGLEFGAGFIDKKLWVNAKLNIVESLRNGTPFLNQINTSIFDNNTEYTSLGFEAAYYITKNIGISAGATTAFNASNIAAAPSYNVGVFYDLK